MRIGRGACQRGGSATPQDARRERSSFGIIARMRRRRLTLTLVMALICAGLLWAAGADARRGGGEQPGEFDFYVMAFSIAPSFCSLSGGERGKRQCARPDDAAYRAQPLTVHGLWPNRNGQKADDQPRSCSAERLTELPPDLAKRLAVVMPGMADGLHSYEWRTHGVCSGLSPETYFRAVVRFADQANATLGAALRERGLLGREVSVGEILDAAAAKSRALAEALVVNCRFAARGRTAGPRAFVDEIRVLIGRDLTRDPENDGWPGSFVARDKVGYGANSGCPGARGYLPAGYGGP